MNKRPTAPQPFEFQAGYSYALKDFSDDIELLKAIDPNRADLMERIHEIYRSESLSLDRAMRCLAAVGFLCSNRRELDAYPWFIASRTSLHFSKEVIYALWLFFAKDEKRGGETPSLKQFIEVVNNLVDLGNED